MEKEEEEEKRGVVWETLRARKVLTYGSIGWSRILTKVHFGMLTN